MINLRHKNLIVYHKSTDLVLEMYRITDRFPDHEKFELTRQIRRAAVSVPSNISEGAARISRKESKRFYDIARSSLVEIDTQIDLAVKLGYIKAEELSRANKLANETFAILSKLLTT